MANERETAKMPLCWKCRDTGAYKVSGERNGVRVITEKRCDCVAADVPVEAYAPVTRRRTKRVLPSKSGRCFQGWSEFLRTLP